MDRDGARLGKNVGRVVDEGLPLGCFVGRPDGLSVGAILG